MAGHLVVALDLSPAKLADARSRVQSAEFHCQDVRDPFPASAAHARVVEKGYYLVEGRPKRFFDRTAVETLFSEGWHALNLKEHTIQRYAKPKVVWQVVAETVA